MKLNLKEFIEPFGKLSKTQKLVMIAVQVIAILSIWELAATNTVSPRPSRIAQYIWWYWTESETFWNSVYNSIILSVQSILISIVISAALMYAYTIQLFKPIVSFIAQMRFLTISALIPVFILLLDTPDAIKQTTLQVGICTFFVASLLSVVDDPKNTQIYQLCKTLKMNRWETLYHTIITGKLRDLAIAIVVNSAIAYMMITTVEGISMSTDGIGVEIFKAQKYLQLDKVFALLCNVMLIGLLISWCGSLIVNAFTYNKKENG